MLKKIVSAILIISITLSIMSAAILSNAEEAPFSISEKIKSFMLVNNPETMERLKVRSQEETIAHALRSIESDEGSSHRSFTQEEREMRINDCLAKYTIIPERSFSFYPLIGIKYTKQYAEKGVFDQILRNDKVWLADNNSRSYPGYYYDKDLSKIPESGKYGKSPMFGPISDDATLEFLNNPEAIEEMIKREIDEEIIDCEIVALAGNFSILYLQGVENDYGIKLFADKSLLKLDGDIELFKVYLIEDIMSQMGNYTGYWGDAKNVYSIKPTYDNEGAALIEEGVLQGNENGLDPLKPMSRIEAAAILVRVLGYDDVATSSASRFSDMTDDYWGTRYANIAFDVGITQGVGDNKFAPEQRIDANQFATLLLRGAEGSVENWQTALNILVERGIITRENADTMDLFTRGDMAKIIYEAREKGLIAK